MNTRDVIQLYTVPSTEGSDIIEYETNMQRNARLINEGITRSLQDEIQTLMEETMRAMTNPPTDRHGKQISVGCTVHLSHNGRDRRVTALSPHPANNGTWIVGCDEGGSFLLPQSRDNVTVLAGGRMSAYDDAVAYLDAEVHPRYDYEIYSDMRDIVDEMETENAKLRELVQDMWEYIYIGTAQDGQSLHDRTRELGIEV